MPAKKSPLESLGAGAEQIAAAALETVKKKAADAVSTPPSGRIIWNSLNTPYLTGTMNPSGGWVHAPANLACFKATEEDLNRLCMRLIPGSSEATKVRACLIEGTKQVYIVPCEENDPDGISINKYSDQIWINLASLLLNAKTRVRAGYRERYNIYLVEESPVGPALQLDLSRRLERRRISSSDKSKPAKGGSNAAPAQAEK